MPSSTILGAALFSAVVAAQSGVQLVTAVGLATQCFPYNGGTVTSPNLGPTPTIIIPQSVGQAITVNIIAPSCNQCGCQGTGCTAINIYQTTYNNFDNRGSLTSQVYVVTESYPGVAATAAPSVLTTSCPLGFTTTVATCTACATPTTATLTVPVTTCPYVTGLSSPSPVPAGVSVSPYQLCTTGLPPAATGGAAAAAAPAPGAPAAGAPAAGASAAVSVAPGAGSAGTSGSSATGQGAAAPAAPGAPAAGSNSGSSAVGANGAAPAGSAAPNAGSNSGANAGSSPAANPATPAGGNTASGASSASTAIVTASASRPAVSVVLGCALGFVIAVAATF